MRLDHYLTENRFFDSGTKSARAIKEGIVTVNGKVALKPSLEVNGFSDVKVTDKGGFVSLGGYKLQKALKDFSFPVQGKTVADIGASTGGFTDCLLQNGADKVYSVDLNDSLLAESLKKDDRVKMICANAKDLTADLFPDITLITADLSFISATLVLPVFYSLLPFGGQVILLIKPQFEMGERKKFKNGIIKDDGLKKKACYSIYQTAVTVGFLPIAITSAPLVDGKNQEFLILLEKRKGEPLSFEKLFKI